SQTAFHSALSANISFHKQVDVRLSRLISKTESLTMHGRPYSACARSRHSSRFAVQRSSPSIAENQSPAAARIPKFRDGPGPSCLLLQMILILGSCISLIISGELSVE